MRTWQCRLPRSTEQIPTQYGQYIIKRAPYELGSGTRAQARIPHLRILELTVRFLGLDVVENNFSGVTRIWPEASQNHKNLLSTSHIFETSHILIGFYRKLFVIFSYCVPTFEFNWSRAYASRHITTHTALNTCCGVRTRVGPYTAFLWYTGFV